MVSETPSCGCVDVDLCGGCDELGRGWEVREVGISHCSLDRVSVERVKFRAVSISLAHLSPLPLYVCSCRESRRHDGPGSVCDVDQESNLKGNRPWTAPLHPNGRR